MRDLSFDEILTLIEDAFDANVAPKRLVRNNDNKMHLMFKADAKGYAVVNEMVMALSQRFDPELCDTSDLQHIAKIIGTRKIEGKASAVGITAKNSSTTASDTLAAGTYQFTSASGERFTFTVDVDRPFSASESKVYYALSQDAGAFRVTSMAYASVSRADGESIPSNFTFSCADNLGYLGRDEETDLEFRRRLISSSDRDDIINEIETAIKSIPGVYECNCVFNALNTQATYDSIELGPKELLVIITGVATDELASAVASRCHYATHMVNAQQVVYYDSPLYVNERYPVYFKYHDTVDYTMTVAYSYDSSKIKQAQAEIELGAILDKLRGQNTHVDKVTEKDVYDLLGNSGIVSVSILNVDLAIGGTPVSYVPVPKTRLPNLTGVVFLATDENGA